MSAQNYSEIRLSRISANPIINGIGEASDVGEPAWPRYIRITDIRGLDQLNPEDKMSLKPALAAKAEVERDDILMAAVGATVGDAYIHQSDDPACFAGYLVRFRANKALAHPRFVAYWTQSSHYRHQIRSGYVGSTIENFSASKYRAMRIPLPGLSVQREVSQFLDRETAKIDALIDKQAQLIATLREESDALWSAELKRLSGLAPSLPIRRVIESIVDGPFGSSLTSSHYSADGARVIRLGNIGVNEFKDDDRAYIPLDYATSLSTHEVKKGDVVVAGLGDDKMPLGRAALVPPIGPAIVKADCYRVRPRAELVRADYLAWALSAPPTRNQIALLARGATRARLNTSVIKEVEIPVPALRDQAEAVSRAREHLSKIDFLVSKATQLSDTLREYRSALITNAVTGRIDVREAV